MAPNLSFVTHSLHASNHMKLAEKDLVLVSLWKVEVTVYFREHMSEEHTLTYIRKNFASQG